MNQQTELDLTARARATDPRTSHKAAADANRRGSPSRQGKIILAALKAAGGPITTAEIAQETVRNAIDGNDVLDRYQVARLMRNMERAGLVVEDDDRECSVVGAVCLTWKLPS